MAIPRLCELTLSQDAKSRNLGKTFLRLAAHVDGSIFIHSPLPLFNPQTPFFSVPPMMWVPDQQLRAVRGGSVTLSCVVESHPEALTFWHHAGRIVQPRGKFFMSTVQGKPSYKVK